MRSLNSLCVLIFFTICSIEARKFFPVCPDCEIRFKESFRGFAMRYINENVPTLPAWVAEKLSSLEKTTEL